MAVSLNTVAGLASMKLRVTKSSINGASIPSFFHVKSPYGAVRLAGKDKSCDFALQVAEGDTSIAESSEITQRSDVDLSSSPSNGSTKQEAEKPKRASLTARERLRAARVLSRFNAEANPKPVRKADLGSKVLDALRESDRGKKSGLPEAPGNMMDDGKRGMPPKGLTFDLPGGNDLFVIVFSFVFISTVMFATTFLVWKVGAIHFNEF